MPYALTGYFPEKYVTNRLKCDSLNLTDDVLSEVEGTVEGLTHLFEEPYA
jgi:hypothetical protein